MKVKFPVYLLLLILLAGSCSATKETNANAALSASNTPKTDAKISLLDDKLSFILPEGFKSLPLDQVKRNLADNESPKNIFSNDKQTAYIKIIFDDTPLETNQLAEVKAFVEKTHQNYSKWITSEIMEMNGRQWFHFEWETPIADKTLVAPVAPDETTKPEIKDEKPLHFREYTTSLNKKKLSIIFESDAQEYSQLKEFFNKSIQTIQVKD